jgi:hypothetical protein
MKAIKVLSVVMSLAAMTLFGASGSWAQDKAKDAKAAPAAKAEKGQSKQNVLLENVKVIVREIRYKPGDLNTNVPRNGRVVLALTSGTLMRTYPDGKTQNVEFKAGDVRFNEPVAGSSPQYTTKNVGKSELVLYIVELK